MIDEKATFEKYGYYSTDLMPQSHKKIVAICDDCGKRRELFKGGYRSLCSSCVKKGREVTEDQRMQLSIRSRGEKNYWYGKHLSEETRRKMSESHRGENHWNWQGGKSFEPYCNRFSFKFKEKIREKYKRKCYLCGKTKEENGERLCVHHIDGDKEQGCDGKSWFVIPLCRSCHASLHNRK